MTGPCRSIPRAVGLAWLAALAPLVVPASSHPLAAAPAPAADQSIASLESARGPVQVIRLGQSLPPTASMPLLRNDVVVTRRGRATVRFGSDGTVLRIGPESRVEIDESAAQRDVKVFFGRLWAHVVRWRERPTRFESSGTIAAIRGTEINFAVESDGDQTTLAVIEGKVTAENEAGRLELEGGQVATARKGQAPSLSVQVRPRDAVRWALYYMPVLRTSPADVPGGSGWQAQVRASSEAYGHGDLGGAIEALEGVGEDQVRDPRFFTHRASLLLAAGSVDDAELDLDRALKLAENDADALALETIVAVVNDRRDEALATARRAVAADPRSATPRIAQSYAQQAGFDLEGARDSVEAAVRLEPGDPLAWARLAEIRSSFGRLDEALEAARKARDLDPSLARTQTVLGFAYLTQVRTGEAKEAFGRAVELDPADPLPRLGLGLARIRDGELDAGSEDLEIAVSLDPGHALVRSYLGKAYFEARRTDLAEREYDVAKAADPRDPTPWLYDAIAKQTTNRPVEALRSLQEAIALNDNRAVYRSRLLLDSDLAARSASLGRLYADLGFQNLALVEGWKSVNTDPANYSAHRLLADSYAALPRHDIARVSELFQSQMLQPLNTTPIQPSLGESSLFLVSAQGPGTLAFNEFNPLFNRNLFNAQGSFLLGQDDTWSGEGIASGIHGKASFSAGFSRFQTDGFRANGDQEDRIANAFAQVALDPSTSIQAEVRHRKLDHGDLELRFFEDDFSLLEAQTNEATSARVGLRRDFGPAVTVLASYMHQDKDIGFSLPEPELAIDFSLDREEKADSVEGQLLYRSGPLKAVAGAGRFDIDWKEGTLVAIDDPFFGLTDSTTTDARTRHTNLYVYSNLVLPGDATVTLGLSGDLFDEDGSALNSVAFPGLPAEDPIPVPAAVVGNKDQANPKLGLTWAPTSGTTLRGAWFRTLKRTLVTDQTLEPTQVAGFNQFFDDPSGTEAWVYGAALDQKFGPRLFGGVEYSHRELTIPQVLVQDDLVVERDGSEDLARAYFFAAPHERLALGVEYQHEDFERDSRLALPFNAVKTQRVPLSARFFHPTGFAALVGVTFLKQEGDFLTERDLERVVVRDDRSFWVVDAALRYRLPRRYGFVSIGVNNLTDERSTYQATDSRNLRIRPGRTVFARMIVAFP